MAYRSSLERSAAALALAAMAVVGSGAQEPLANPAVASPRLPNTPQIFSYSGQQLRVVPLMGFSYPWALLFLPGGDMLVSERGVSTLRRVRNGVLDPRPITGLPKMIKGAGSRAGVDLALHPRFAENRLLYFTYWKPKPEDEDIGTAVLGRARYDGDTLTEVQDLFVSDGWTDGPAASRLVFGRDGKIYMTVGSPGFSKKVGTALAGQNPGTHAGKVLRLNDDGTVPADNPFIGRPGFKPEIYAYGLRNAVGLMVHPETGELWETDNGPQGGDEINIIKAGMNYGWPVITYGRAYNYDTKGERSGLPGPEIQPPTSAPGMEQPILYYVPSIAIAGIAIYTGDKFPTWKGNIFVGGLKGTQLSRIQLNRQGLETRRETLLAELGQRIRDVKQGPDGNLYVTTDEKDGALLRIEPVKPIAETSSK